MARRLIVTPGDRPAGTRTTAARGAVSRGERGGAATRTQARPPGVRTQTITSRPAERLASTNRPARPAADPAGSALSWLLPIRAASLVTWELAAVVAVLLLHRWPPGDRVDRVPAVATITVAALAILLTSLRWRALTAAGWAAALVRYRSARRRPRTDPSADDPLAQLMPDVRLRAHLDRAGNRAGIAHVLDRERPENGSWVGVVRVMPSARTDPATLVEVARTVLGRTDIPLAAVQLTEWTLPSPSSPDNPATAARVYWLSVRYRPADAPRAALARGGGDTGATRAAGTATFVLARDLVESGHDAAVLDAEQLRRSLLVALGCDPATVAGAHSPAPVETWTDCAVGRARQACFLLRARREQARAFGRFSVGAAFCCTSLTLTRTRRGGVASSLIVRIGTDPERTRLGVDTVARGLGLTLSPANGRHARLTRRSLPLAL